MTPPLVRTTLAAVRDVDHALHQGPAHAQPVMADLAGVIADGPVAETLRRDEGPARSDHYVALAVGRATALARAHDQLLDHASSTLGRPLRMLDPPPLSAVPPALDATLDAARVWLVQRADMGLAQPGQVDEGLAASLHAEPRTRRLAALLLTLARPQPDPHRAAALWSRAVLETVLPTPPTGVPVTGTLTLLGASLHAASHVARLTVWGALERGGRAQLVHTPVTVWQETAWRSGEPWRALVDVAPQLCGAVTERASLHLDEALLDGDLLDVSHGSPLRQSTSTADLTELWTASADRRPDRVAIPLAAHGLAAIAPVPVDWSTTHPDDGWEAADCGDVLGLLRWRDGWVWQPLHGVETGTGTTIGSAGPLEVALAERDARTSVWVGTQGPGLA